MIASGLTGPSLWRPAHLHFMVSADGCKPLTTHLFVKGAPHINEDARLSLLVILD
jgi:protocatechuate 3,4-dioxygenase beta subunit